MKTKTKSMRYKTVWVVEILHSHYTKWHCTVGTGLTKEDGIKEMRRWAMRNPNDKFRLTKYHSTRES